MKKLFLFWIAIFLLSVANLSQADMLEVKKDTTINSAVEKSIIYFSNAEIAEIIKNSADLNPTIGDLNVIQLDDVVNFRIDDSTVYSASPSKGGSCWGILVKGVEVKKIKPISFLKDKIKARADSIFLDKVDSILGNPQQNYFLKHDFNLPKQESLFGSKIKKGTSLNKEKLTVSSLKENLKEVKKDTFLKEDDSLKIKEALQAYDDSLSLALDLQVYSGHNMVYGYPSKVEEDNLKNNSFVTEDFVILSLLIGTIIFFIGFAIKKNIKRGRT